ncbi:MAG: UDP-N-acetylglucosamine--N-acetylmuramyl-(pentapeptide) pyrophosphoryl-undecaprenol N-acetylglucosamine transferase [Patescibacteria group bacterium]
MKIVFTGGGTAGHFYPIIAVVEQLTAVARERKLVNLKYYFLSDHPYDERALFENHIEFRRVRAGRLRRYFSLRIIPDFFQACLGVIEAIFKLYRIYPDLVFCKGGYASFPVVAAARLLRIPIFVHESDSRPGRVNYFAARQAVRIALGFAEAATFFPKDKQGIIAVTGNPIRRDLLFPLEHGAREFLGLEAEMPIIYVTGGSQGAAIINETLLDILPGLLEKCQIVHQVGKQNLPEVSQRASIVLEKSTFSKRYKPLDFLNSSAIRMVAGASSLVISRAGSSIFEFAQWGLPAILIPIPESVSHDQRTNAFTYARSGGAIVIEQGNLTPSVLQSEILRLLGDQELLAKMQAGAKSFARPRAARLIAEEILEIAVSHEK